MSRRVVIVYLPSAPLFVAGLIIGVAGLVTGDSEMQQIGLVMYGPLGFTRLALWWRGRGARAPGAKKR